ncbi:MAG TPA: GTPase [Bryobacteraceae bacterium]|jgi:flagellar biosynthesis protein FlhF|nr:GTPase [Bryobacteraceae bacterium]
MRLKSYFSGTVEAAMELAHKELGEDALLINARPSTPETRSLGAYEVVFGMAPKAEVGEKPAENRIALVNAPARAAATDSLAQDVADLKREIERMAQSFRGAGMFAPQVAATMGSALYNLLIDNELDANLARQVADGTPLEDLFEVDPTPGRRGATRGVVALVGPPGVGKTTTLAKLAARFGLTSRKPAYILSADVYRIAAAEQMRSLSAILGIGFDIVETPVALAQALEEHRGKDWVFIDTPGLAAGEMEDGADLAHLLATHPEIDTHLVLSASMKRSDLARVIDRYAIFQPKKLLFTRLDETDRYGALVSEAARRSLPISFLATGQQIPDDLEPASKEFIADKVRGAPTQPTTRTLGATA